VRTSRTWAASSRTEDKLERMLQFIEELEGRLQARSAPPADAAPLADAALLLPFLDMVTTGDLTYLDRPGGHIGLMAGSKARTQIWPDIAAWMAGRSAA
jgi:hypothetical protein